MDHKRFFSKCKVRLVEQVLHCTQTVSKKPSTYTLLSTTSRVVRVGRDVLCDIGLAADSHMCTAVLDDVVSVSVENVDVLLQDVVHDEMTIRFHEVGRLHGAMQSPRPRAQPLKSPPGQRDGREEALARVRVCGLIPCKARLRPEPSRKEINENESAKMHICACHQSDL